MATHPVLTPTGLAFKAPPLTEFLQEFSRLVSIGELSLACVGLPRTGKSTARRFLETQFESNKKMAVYSAGLQKGGGRRGSFWRDFLRQQSASMALMSHLPYDALFNDILATSDRLGTEKVLVIIDEAQNLTIQKLAALKKLTDELQEHDLAPFTLLFAQSDWTALLDSLTWHGHFDLVDRFFSRRYRYRGLYLNEIAGFLQAYDQNRWPADSGTAYTQFFAPERWQQGWRLASAAPDFVEAFRAHLVPGEKEVRMKFVAMAARALLVNLRTEPPTKARVEAVVRDSGIVQARLMPESEGGKKPSGKSGRKASNKDDLEVS